MRRLTLLLGLLVLAFGVPACGGGNGETAAPDEAEMDRLRALPYVDASSPAEGRAASGLVIRDRQRSSPGHTLYTVQMLGLAELIDDKGAVVRRWRAETRGRWERAELLPGGDLAVIGADDGGLDGGRIADESRYLSRLAPDGTARWTRRMTAHHDVEAVPGGGLLVLGFQRRPVPAIDPGIEVRDDLLMLLDDDGKVLEIRSLFDAFWTSPEVHRLRPVRPDRQGVRPWIDLFHANSVEWIRRPALAGRHPIYDPGNVLVSLRNQSCIAVVNWAEGRLVWTWGAGQLLGPHDAQVLANGNILVFDNGMGRGWSRVLEVDPTRGEIVWEYRAPEPTDFYTLSKGSNQRLPNGNTLVANSDHGEAFEVTPAGEIVWLYRNPHFDDEGRRAAIVRATRYGPEFLAPLLD